MDWLARLHPRAAQAPSAARPVLGSRFASVAPVSVLATLAPTPSTADDQGIDSNIPSPGHSLPATPFAGAAPATSDALGVPSPTLSALQPLQPLQASGADRPAPAPAGMTARSEPLAAHAPAPGLPTGTPHLPNRDAAAARTVLSVQAFSQPDDPLRPPRPRTASLDRPAPPQGSPFGAPRSAARPDQPLTHATRLPGIGDTPPPAPPLVVQVSIDRIEVRAPANGSPRQAPANRTSAAAPRGVSLSDYLRGPRGGGRS